MIPPLHNTVVNKMNSVKISIKDYLAEHEILAYHISGISMKPMLRQEKDLVVIRRYDGKGLHKYDVAMYDRGGPRRYVLHRVIEVHDGYYTFLGDNCIRKEENIPENSIVAVLDSFKKKEKHISLNNPIYRIYVRMHCSLYPFRKFCYIVRASAAKVPLLKKIYRFFSEKVILRNSLC